MKETSLVEIRKRFEGTIKPVHKDFPRQAAVLLAITDELQPKIILTQRAAHMRRHAGEVAFPGGKRDEEDRSLIATALRESEEEIGLPPNCVDVVGELPAMLTRYDVQVTAFVGMIPSSQRLTVNQQELSSVFGVPVDFLRQRDNLFVDEVEYRGVRRKVPRFEYQGYSVWGITAYLLFEFVNTVYGPVLLLD